MSVNGIYLVHNPYSLLETPKRLLCLSNWSKNKILCTNCYAFWLWVYLYMFMSFKSLWLKSPFKYSFLFFFFLNTFLIGNWFWILNTLKCVCVCMYIYSDWDLSQSWGIRTQCEIQCEQIARKRVFSVGIQSESCSEWDCQGSSFPEKIHCLFY